MVRKKKLRFKIKNIFLLAFGFLLGVISIWPGLLSGERRQCFLKILRDGSDGNVTLNTVFSLGPEYLIKVKNTKNLYIKVLLIGDSCFR